jgi:thymidylate synthase
MISLWADDDANEVWFQLAREFARRTDLVPQQSRCGDVFELMHTCITIRDPRKRWIVARQPAINPAFAIAEVVSLMTGRNDAQFLNFWNSELPKYSGICDNYLGAYGYRLHSHFGFDQIRRAVDALAANPNSRQVVLQLWDASVDLPFADGVPRCEDVPCNTEAMLKIREGKLEWMQVVRSNDLYRGLPYNIVQFTSLQEIIAGWLGLGIGSYNHLADSLHVYAPDYSAVCTAGHCATAANTDVLSEGYEVSVNLFREIERRMDAFARGTHDAQEILSLSDMPDAPTAYRNLLCVLGAHAARKNRLHDSSSVILSQCTNPMLNQICHSWLSRSKGEGSIACCGQKDRVAEPLT